MNFLRDYLLGKVLDFVVSGIAQVTEAQARAVGQRVEALQAEGHSRECANVIAADEFNLLDASPATVRQLGHIKCPKGCS